jgi:hypothetical protein
MAISMSFGLHESLPVSVSVAELLLHWLQFSLWLLLSEPRPELLLPAKLVPNSLAVPTVLKLERGVSLLLKGNLSLRDRAISRRYTI